MDSVVDVWTVALLASQSHSSSICNSDIGKLTFSLPMSLLLMLANR